MNKSKNQSVVILGAGLAGLAAGYELTKAGYKVTIIEKWDDVGGLARTIEKKGHRFDTGPHRWYTKNDMVNTWMLKLMGDEVVKIPRLTRIYFDHKFFNYPIKIKDTLMGMGVVRTLRAVVDYLLIRVWLKISKKQPVTLEEGFTYQFGKTLYEMFFRRYSEKLWGTSCKNIAAEWIGQRTRGFNITTVIKKALFDNQKVVSFVDEFSYPKKGIGRIAQKMAEVITKEGGKILLNNEVIGVAHDGKRITAVRTRGRQPQTLEAHDVVSSIPLSDLVRMLTPVVPQHIISINSQLSYRNELQIALFVNKAHLTADTWVYVHSLDLPFVRFMEMDNWTTRLSPQGTTTLVFEVTCNEGDEIWRMSDQDAVNMVTKAFIKEFGLITHRDILGSYVHRVPKEYPIYHLGYKNDLAVIKKYLDQFGNLQLIGRNGTFRYNNMDHSVEMGLYAAWNILEGERKFDIESVNLEREYLEEKKLKAKEIELPEDEHVEDEHH